MALEGYSDWSVSMAERSATAAMIVAALRLESVQQNATQSAGLSVNSYSDRFTITTRITPPAG
jgi:hypothetical protein